MSYMYPRYRVYANRTQAKKYIMIDFLVKVVILYIKIHCEKSYNANFLALIRFYILFAQTQHSFNRLYMSDAYMYHQMACTFQQMMHISVMAAKFEDFSISHALATGLST